MGHSAGSGDKLARGAVKASYLTTEKKITQKKWDDMFGDFDPEKFQERRYAQGEGHAQNVQPGVTWDELLSPIGCCNARRSKTRVLCSGLGAVGQGPPLSPYPSQRRQRRG